MNYSSPVIADIGMETNPDFHASIASDYFNRNPMLKKKNNQFTQKAVFGYISKPPATRTVATYRDVAAAVEGVWAAAVASIVGAVSIALVAYVAVLVAGLVFFPSFKQSTTK